MTPGSTPVFDCPHSDHIAVLVTLPGGEHSITCPRCASARVNAALDAGVDETCIVITQESIGDKLAEQRPDPEAAHRARWPEWAHRRISVTEPGY